MVTGAMSRHDCPSSGQYVDSIILFADIGGLGGVHVHVTGQGREVGLIQLVWTDMNGVVLGQDLRKSLAGDV